jgi:hypothetical protein
MRSGMKQLLGPNMTVAYSQSKAPLKPSWWLTPIILATQEAEIRRITV